MASSHRLASLIVLMLVLSVSEGARIKRHRHNRTARALVLETAGRLMINEDGDENGYYLSTDVGDGDKLPKTPVFLDGGKGVKIPFDSRYYIMKKPNMRSSPNRDDFRMFSLMDKTLEYTVDLHGAGCGCNSAIYTISMPHAGLGAGNDWYCDANNVGGQACPEFDLSEMNSNTHKTVMHGCTTPWKEENCDKWGPPSSTFNGGTFQRGANIDSTKPFTVKHSFTWTQVITTITQNGRSESRTMHGLDTEMGMPHLKGRSNGMSEALRDGQVIAISFWGSEDMTWLDGCNLPNGGPGAFKGYGNPDSCAAFWTMSDVKVSSNADAPTPAPGRDLLPEFGCCKFGDHCGDCGNDGKGWCHKSSSNCAACNGWFDGSSAAPACR